MTYNEIIRIATKLDKKTKKRIDVQVEERLNILKLGELSEEELGKMEDCLYMSLVIQEYLDGEYELIDEERLLLLEEMEELYGSYNDLLLKAKLEEKVSKKKRMALELMRIREQLFKYKDRVSLVKKEMKDNRETKELLENMSSKEKMEEIAKDNIEYKKGNYDKESLPNPDKMDMVGFDNDTQVVKNTSNKEKELERKVEELDNSLKIVEQNSKKSKEDKNEGERTIRILKENILDDLNEIDGLNKTKMSPGEKYISDQRGTCEDIPAPEYLPSNALANHTRNNAKNAG